MTRRYDLPVMTLCNGCGDCCGPVSARPDEVKRIRHYVRDNVVEWAPPEATKCGFLRLEEDRQSCAIYAVRPWACRAFGLLEEMRCPHFPEAVVTSMPAEQAIRRRLMDPGDQLLGEVFEPGYLLRLARELVPEPEVVDAVATVKGMRRVLAPYGDHAVLKMRRSS